MQAEFCLQVGPGEDACSGMKEFVPFLFHGKDAGPDFTNGSGEG